MSHHQHPQSATPPATPPPPAPSAAIVVDAKTGYQQPALANYTTQAQVTARIGTILSTGVPVTRPGNTGWPALPPNTDLLIGGPGFNGSFLDILPDQFHGTCITFAADAELYELLSIAGLPLG